MKRNVLIFGLLCTVCMAVQANERDIAFITTHNVNDVLYLVDNLPFRYDKYHEPDIYIYEKSPLNFYTDTTLECINNKIGIQKVEVLYVEERNSSYIFIYTRAVAEGYIIVNYKVYQFLVDKKIETMQHSYHYYINDKIIDERNYEQLLRLRKSSIKSVNVELDSQTDAIIVEIKTKRRM